MKYVCKKCGTEGDGKKITPGSFFVEICLFIFFLFLAFTTSLAFLFVIPVYSFWRFTGSYKGCAECNSKDIIPSESPIGKQILSNNNFKMFK